MKNLVQDSYAVNPPPPSFPLSSYQSIDTIDCKDDAYPSQLKKVASAPPALFAKGDLAPGVPRAAVIGTRKPSSFSLTLTRDLVSGLVELGYSITSGLALGIDAQAHRAAFDAEGHTVAVLPCGIERVYPSSHRALAEGIVGSGGALLSEHSGDERPTRWSFVWRNRLISGMSDAVFFVEGAIKSGSMHTARYALLQGRPLYVPVRTLDGIEDLSEGARALVELKGPELAQRVHAKGHFREILEYRFEDRPVAQVLSLDALDLICGVEEVV